MALKVSKNATLTDIVSDANPITTVHPITGSEVTVILFLFNDNATKRYENIAIDPVDIIGSDDSTWIQLAPDVNGSAGTFLEGGAPLAMPNISDSNVGRAFWMKVTTPSVSDSQNKTDIKLTVTAKEYAV